MDQRSFGSVGTVSIQMLEEAALAMT